MKPFKKIGKRMPPLRNLREFRGKKYPWTGTEKRKWQKPLSDVDRLEKFCEGVPLEMTLPERCIYKALTIRNYQFDTQVPAPSARLDFLVYLGNPGVAIRVQGARPCPR